MVRVLIHSCNQRLWYVGKYLIPSLKAQGVEEIRVFNDDVGLGCVYACMAAFRLCDGNGHTWHLQDGH